MCKIIDEYNYSLAPLCLTTGKGNSGGQWMHRQEEPAAGISSREFVAYCNSRITIVPSRSSFQYQLDQHPQQWYCSCSTRREDDKMAIKLSISHGFSCVYQMGTKVEFESQSTA